MNKLILSLAINLSFITLDFLASTRSNKDLILTLLITIPLTIFTLILYILNHRKKEQN